MALTFFGFASPWTSHRHFLKHVARVSGLPRRQLESQDDPERWRELMRGTIPSALDSRRSSVLAELRGVSRCVAGRLAPTTSDACATCRDLSAVQQVAVRLERPLGEYERVARSVYEWNRDHAWQRLLVRKTADGMLAEAWDPRFLFMGGFVREPSAALAASTLYRRNWSPRQIALEIERNRAAYESSGTLVNPEAL